MQYGHHFCLALALSCVGFPPPACPQRASDRVSQDRNDALRDELQRSIWDALNHGLTQHAVAYSQALLQADPDNALASAGLLSSPTPRAPEEVLNIGRRGLRAVQNLRHWPGMPEDQFTQMTRRVRIILNAAVGKAYLDLHDEVTARKYLKEVVALNPSSARDTYNAGLAYLNGKNPELTLGYWLLARTVVLAQTTPEGKQIGQYSFERYLAAGGTVDDWKKYLQRATSPAPPLGMEAADTSEVASTAPPVATTSQNGSSTATSSVTEPKVSSGPTSSGGSHPTAEVRAATEPSTAEPTITKSDPASQGMTAENIDPRDREALQRSLPQAEGEHRETPREIASNIPPTAPPPPNVADNVPLASAATTEAIPRVPSAPPLQIPKYRVGEPISLGVLIQAKIASRQNREAVIYALSDMFRRLRDDDEAFIVSYGKGIDFEQDLTWNYDALERAMESIRPESGAALLDAVAFSAGHLERVAKNSNRVLIVISDGDDLIPTPGTFPVELSKGATRVYCIGIGVGARPEQMRLQQLADRTGGSVTYIRDATEFRHAIHQLAAGLGIDFQE